MMPKMGDFHDRSLGRDACLLLSNDPKPRLRWTAELHERFVEAVTHLGGPDKATPKTLMRAMGVKGLTLYHLKSHLQKYRMGKQASKEATITNASDIVADQATGRSSSSSSSSSKAVVPELNDGCNEAMRVQMELQRSLHQQIEVQRHLEIRIDAHGKYLQSMLERALNALVESNILGDKIDVIRFELCGLPVNETSEFMNLPSESNHLSSLSGMSQTYLEEKHINRGGLQQIGECSVESCLTSTESPGILPVLGQDLMRKTSFPMMSCVIQREIM